MKASVIGFVGLPLPFTQRPHYVSQRKELHSTPPARYGIAYMQASTAGAKQVLSTDRASKLPWTETIANDECPLFFMPFVEHQLSITRELPGLADLPFDEHLSYQKSEKPVARIESWAWKSTHFRKIRATYIDAGYKAQVFNSVWYPNPSYEHPLLGIDFLSFGKKKVLCVMDFQPLSQDKNYLEKYCARVKGIKEKYEGLSGTMSARFYDEAQFFSRQLVFAKFDNPGPIGSELFPAFKEYVEEYVNMIMEASPDESESSVSRVLQLHKDYDQYSAERDPAIGLFSTYWGKEWASAFTHEFLFSDSEPISEEQH
ncbi:15,16-dihydrobiliverdin:ferredoxin oxidoreductase [Gracilariopsis chorda]|uniref:15,16-dihydrobiliverdin:ferredoxin oxidoreductase n=1 Tax=Gracilariopsis chorda TaxID=448386 RepID=A0A2V3ILS1_9FLOR|nr:15,16-dihydrobiliverdin:ferredoxin oxidoreductase [Gracilariopsis chorda]|eukprot:PXF42070.1 15,16-dihydrobiliverdin:ferredoxin oxidoreductase [Gracilariopsis chorda]